jgi:hypothetical protein
MKFKHNKIVIKDRNLLINISIYDIINFRAKLQLQECENKIITDIIDNLF